MDTEYRPRVRSAAIALAGEIVLTADVLSEKQLTTGRPWLEVPIRVQLTDHALYEDLDFTVTLFDLPLGDHELVERGR